MEQVEQKVKERPILFSTPMVKAILEGRKTVTRRVLDLTPDLFWIKQFGYTVFTPDGHISGRGMYNNQGPAEKFFKLKYGKPGDVLWVRETLYQEGELGIGYVAGREPIEESIIPEDHKPYRNYAFCNIPNIHMPRWACRLRLKIKSIRVERLHDITEEDAIREGIEKDSHGWYKNYLGHDQWGNEFGCNALESFKELWQSINGKESWEANPWVWRIEFEKL